MPGVTIIVRIMATLRKPDYPEGPQINPAPKGCPPPPPEEQRSSPHP